MPAYNENLRQELEMIQSKAGQEKLEKLYNSLMAITEMSDEDCDRIENEFKNSEEKNNRTFADALFCNREV